LDVEKESGGNLIIVLGELDMSVAIKSSFYFAMARLAKSNCGICFTDATL
jgi:hypothetical protein